MTDDLEELRRRLVVGHKSDGRSVYDEVAKAELVTLCLQPGASVSRLARECGVNANQVGRWLRERGHGRRPHPEVKSTAAATTAFVAVPVVAAPRALARGDEDEHVPMSLKARLPNGVAIDLHGIALRTVGEVIKAFGELRCSVSTKA
jgi:transposase